MNFTSDVKKEIIARGSVPGRRGESERKAAISAFLRTSGDVGLRDGAPVFYFVSETENVAEFFMSLFVETFGVELYISHATMDKMSGMMRNYMFSPIYVLLSNILSYIFYFAFIGFFISIGTKREPDLFDQEDSADEENLDEE